MSAPNTRSVLENRAPGCLPTLGIIELYRKGMAEGANRRDVTGLLIAIETSCGTRKGGIIDPNVEFYSWKQWQALKRRAGLPAPIMGFGAEEDPDGFVSIDEDRFADTFPTNGMEHVMVQKGVLKSEEESINKYLAAGDDSWISQRSYSKPCLVLTAAEIVKAVRRFRVYFDLKKSTFRGRRIEANNFGSAQIRPIMQKYFGRSMAKADARGWNFGTHHGRRCYAVSAWGIYGDQVQLVTSKYIDRSRFMSKILFHDPNSLNTYLSYNTVVVQFKLSDEVFKTIAKERERDLHAKMSDMQKQIDELKKMILNQAEAASSDDRLMIAFTNRSGEQVTIRKRTKRNFKSTDDRDREIQSFVEKLTDRDIEPSKTNLQKLGFGKNILTKWQKRVPQKLPSAAAPAAASPPAPASPASLQDRALQASVVLPGELEVGSKVIAVKNPEKASLHTYTSHHV